MAEPVGTIEIATRLTVTRDAVNQWRRREIGFPEPRWLIGGRPAWDWDLDIVPWARETGRLTQVPDAPAETSWLNGWEAYWGGGPTVLIGSGVRCIGCGADRGVICVAIDEDWQPPDRDPDWPFPKDQCPICELQQELWRRPEPEPWPRGKPRPLP